MKVIDKLKEMYRDQKELKVSQQSQWAFMQLQTLFERPTFIPMTRWSMSTREILHIINYIQFDDAGAIVELGSGATTVYIAQCLKKKKSAQPFISVESDKEWMELIQTQLDALGLSKFVTLIHAPLTQVQKKLAYKTQESWYDDKKLREALSHFKNVGFVIVDGPYGQGTPYARYSAFPFFRDFTSEKTVWFLDDTVRLEEKEISKQWSTISGLQTMDKNGYHVLLSEGRFDLSPYELR